MSVQTTERPAGSFTADERTADNEALSSTGLLSKLATDVGDLMRTEAALARSEINGSITGMKAGVTALVSGAVVLLPGVLMVLASVALMMTTFLNLSLWLSTLITGAVVSVIGLIMLKGGQKKLSANDLALSRTQRSLGKDQSMIEEKIR